MNPHLAELLAAQPASCRLWPEQTEGPYDRPVHPERRDITEDRIGLPLRVGLRLVDAQTGTPLVGVPVEVWHADHTGRYAGYAPFTPRPGEVVTSASVPNEIVAPFETFLRGVPGRTAITDLRAGMLIAPRVGDTRHRGGGHDAAIQFRAALGGGRPRTSSTA